MSGFNGHLRLSAIVRPDGQTVIGEQAFRAPFHISKPYWDGQTLILQVVNPTAGILEGDTLCSEVAVQSGAALLLTSPSASRVFQMKAGSARSTQRFDLHAGSWFEFWPEPLVPHLDSSFHQSTELVAENGAEFMIADTFLPGRLARGEVWAWARLCLEFKVRVGGELILQERLEQSGSQLKRLAAMAGLEGGAAFANIVVGSNRLGSDTEWLAQISRLQSAEVKLGVSRLRGAAPCFSIKIVATDGDVLRRTLKEIRRILSRLLIHLAADPRKL